MGLNNWIAKTCLVDFVKKQQKIILKSNGQGWLISMKGVKMLAFTVYLKTASASMN